MSKNQFNPEINQQDQRGLIYIEIPKLFYTGGDDIEGILHISLMKEFKGSFLAINLLGIEETSFTDVSNQKRKQASKQSVISPFTGSNVFLNLTIPLYDFSNGDKTKEFVLKPGNWSIPFKLNTTSELPSSLHFKNDEENYCFIRYTLNAYIFPTNQCDQPIQGSQEICLRQSSLLTDDEFLENEYERSPRQCCFKTGSYTLQANINAVNFIGGETIQLVLLGDFTKFTSKVDYIDVSLDGRLCIKSKTPQQIKKYFNLYSIQYEIKVENKKCQQTINISIPKNSPSSILSELIELQFSVNAKAITSTCFVEPSDPLNFNIQINSNEDYNDSFNNQQQLPQNWQPEVLQRQIFDSQQAIDFQKISIQFFSQDQSNIKNQKTMEEPRMNNPLV
ncbi:arrestin (macronuclear) [Tetrahymena thermophila SB210]|uniref:Arrestin n=1 Tax=Tetrahymena thermophila (strain SB210) TaxID=312017 RepID=Q23JY5_TETTS|nr:arrestin [Tetrahymena thermophila SB210]EAR97058.1 arrestin [Tetrahymena thermophila SB210]|eukprot:XP_001017303.1 arrestin [Tetrahymena thermophila SB210]